MSNSAAILDPWCRQLVEALELDGLEVDIDEVLSLAGEAAHTVVRPAAPLTTFIVGFAAGSAAATGQASNAVSIRAASAVARKLIQRTKVDAGTAADTVSERGLS